MVRMFTSIYFSLVINNTLIAENNNKSEDKIWIEKIKLIECQHIEYLVALQNSLSLGMRVETSYFFLTRRGKSSLE